MNETAVATVVFVALSGVSLVALGTYRRFLNHPDRAEIDDATRGVANVFVLMTSLVLGLMINSARNSYDDLNRDVRAVAAQAVSVDRVLRAYGEETVPARAELKAYLRTVIDERWAGEAPRPPRQSMTMLTQLSAEIRGLQPQSDDKRALRANAESMLDKLAEQRWALNELSRGANASIPFILLVITWLVVIFASLAHRAPRNRITTVIFLGAAALIAATFYLILDMERAFDGPIQVRPDPLIRAIREIESPPAPTAEPTP